MYTWHLQMNSLETYEWKWQAEALEKILMSKSSFIFGPCVLLLLSRLGSWCESLFHVDHLLLATCVVHCIAFNLAKALAFSIKKLGHWRLWSKTSLKEEIIKMASVQTAGNSSFFCDFWNSAVHSAQICIMVCHQDCVHRFAGCDSTKKIQKSGWTMLQRIHHFILAWICIRDGKYL